MKIIDILCIGVTSYDLYYQIDHHLAEDEKLNALSFAECGGGPAANAAFTAARLGASSAFMGYLGNDHFGRRHLQELQKAGVDTSQVVHGDYPTPLSTIIIKPGGQRALINYRDQRGTLQIKDVDPNYYKPAVILMDGHEPEISLEILVENKDAITILDAGSVHRGTELLLDKVNYLICSKKFAVDFTGNNDPIGALRLLSSYAPNVIITLGEKGLVWKNQTSQGRLPAFEVEAIDTTGAGDVFHGAFSFCLAKEHQFEYALKYSSAAAALGCTKIGGRFGVPEKNKINHLMNIQNVEVVNIPE